MASGDSSATPVMTPERKSSPSSKQGRSPRDGPGQVTPLKLSREQAAEAAVGGSMEELAAPVAKPILPSTSVCETSAAAPDSTANELWAGSLQLNPQPVATGWTHPMEFVPPPPGLAMDFSTLQNELWQMGQPLILPAPILSLPAGVDGSNAAVAQASLTPAVGTPAAHGMPVQGTAAVPATSAPDKKGQEPKSSRAATQRTKRIIQLIEEMLSSEEGQSWLDKDGYVSIAKLLRARQDLQREAFGSTKVIVQAIEAQVSGPIRLDQERRRARLQTTDELIRSVAERDILSAPHGSVPLQRIVTAKALQHALKPHAHDREDVVRQALMQEESQVTVQGSWVVRRPRGTQLRRLAEDLFSEAHLSQDARLRAKIADSPNGEVPLTWLCGRYVQKLCTASTGGARAAEVSAVELCEALQESQVVIVDARRLTLRRASPGKDQPGASSDALETANIAPAPTPLAGNAPADGATAPVAEKRTGTARAVSQLRQLLDFYFEPFTLQHNRYLLDLLARRIGPPKEAGPWVPEALFDFSFTFDDLVGLGRIAAALSKLKPMRDALTDLGRLKHLKCESDGKMKLRVPPEVRSFVPATGARPQEAEAAARYLSAAREQRGQAPAGMLSVLSYAVAGPLTDQTENGHHRCARLKRQLLVHHADLVFLQGLDSEGSGASLAATLSEEGYAFACARADNGEANSIFWDRTRWELLGTQEQGAVLAVDLRPFEEPSTPIRAICMRPVVPMTRTSQQLRHLFSGPRGIAPGEGPLLVCTDLTCLGGAEGASILEELAGLPSVMQEILGEELVVPLASACPPGQCPQPRIATASGLNKLHSPDAVLFRNMRPVVALSGHTEGYLATMSSQDVLQQFPAFRMPIVAAFDRRATYEPEGSTVLKSGAKLVRI